MIQAQLSGEKITSNEIEAFSLYEKSRFGEKKDSKIEYSPIETLFLVSENKISILSGKKQLKEDILLKRFKKNDKKIETKLIAYKNLRKRGYILKTALKYGADFRVYEKGIKPGEDHARWVLFVVKENEPLSWHEFAAKNRIAHSTKKNLLIAIVDEESDVSYYEISWRKP
jgi:tRNA-intron endonuclease, archaea type